MPFPLYNLWQNYYTICGVSVIPFVAFLLYHLWRFCYTICGFASYGSVSCLIEREIEATSLRSACTALGW